MKFAGCGQICSELICKCCFSESNQNEQTSCIFENVLPGTWVARKDNQRHSYKMTVAVWSSEVAWLARSMIAIKWGRNKKIEKQKKCTKRGHYIILFFCVCVCCVFVCVRFFFLQFHKNIFSKNSSHSAFQLQQHLLSPLILGSGWFIAV